LIFTGQSGEQSIEAHYEDATIWLTQKLMGELFAVTVPTNNEHLKNIFSCGELVRDSVIRKFRITASNGKQYNTNFYNLDILHDKGKISAKVAQNLAETEFEKFRIVQDRLFESDFDKAIKQIEGRM